MTGTRSKMIEMANIELQRACRELTAAEADVAGGLCSEEDIAPERLAVRIAAAVVELVSSQSAEWYDDRRDCPHWALGIEARGGKDAHVAQHGTVRAGLKTVAW